MKRINITSGEYLNNYLLNKYDGVFISFNEAMIEGDLIYPVFGDDFIKKRALVHSVSEDFYISKIEEVINIKEYISEVELITLWFGKDAFCQINMLTLLVYLEMIGYKNIVTLNIVDDETCEVIERNISIILGSMKDTYIDLINGNKVLTKYDFLTNGLNDYLYITSTDNHFIQYINSNINISEEELLINLLSQTSKYGLSDTFIMNLIKRVRK